MIKKILSGLVLFAFFTIPTVVLGANQNLILSQTAFNITQGKEATGIIASPGDTLRYTLSTTNSDKKTIFGYIASIDLIDVLDDSELLISDSDPFKLEGKSIKFNPVDIQANEKVTHRFAVKVNNKPVNFVLKSKYGNGLWLGISKVGVLALNAETSLYVRNVSRKEDKFKVETEAFFGEQLEYLLWVKNVGNLALTNLEVKPMMPFQGKVLLALDTGATLVNQAKPSALTLTNNSWSTLFSKLIQNDTLHLKFKAVVSDETERQLVIAVSVRANDLTVQNASAPIWVVKKPVAKPEDKKEEKKVEEKKQEEVKIQPAVAQTTTVVPVKVLPKAGANEAIGASALSVVSIFGLIYRRQKKWLDILLRGL